MNKIAFLCVILSTITLLLPANVIADGSMYIMTYGRDEWVLIGQDEQVCAIDYESGKENMIIAVRGELEGSKAVWLLPIPAKPEETTIDIIKEFPKFSGYEVKSKVGYELYLKIPYFTLSQIYLIYPIVAFYNYFNPPFGASKEEVSTGLKDTSVTIHEHLERASLTAEVITAKNETKLYAYLKEKNLDLPSESLSLIREYIGKDYSFIVFWISDVTKYKQETGGNVLGIKVVFPTKEIYYPLKLTSIYGERIIPITIYVSGHVTPKLYKEIKDETKVNYYSGDKKYTKIEINTNSNHFVEDLWISRFAPPEILLADFILLNPTIFLIMVFALLSSMASIFSGLIVFRGEVSLKKLVLLGLSNFLTLLGFSIATYVALKEKKKTGKLSFGILYSLLLLTDLLFIGGYVFMSEILIFLSIIFVLPTIAMMTILAIKDKRVRFILLFSIIFLILTSVFNFFMTSVCSYEVYWVPTFSRCRSTLEIWCIECENFDPTWSKQGGLEPFYEVKECAKEYFGISIRSCRDAKELCGQLL